VDGHLSGRDGAHNRSVATMAEAIKDFPSAECDVLLRDIGLPDGNGSDLLPRLCLKKPIVAIAMTGLGWKATVQRAKLLAIITTS
jgi:DNA-binding NarL/FixJ family response regulator